MDQLQGITCRTNQDSVRRHGLAGLSKSRALFSFQRSVCMSRAFWRHGHVVRRSQRREADGELSHICCWCQQGLLRRALFLQHGQYRAGATACQTALALDRPTSPCALHALDLSAMDRPGLEPSIVMGLTRKRPRRAQSGTNVPTLGARTPKPTAPPPRSRIASRASRIHGDSCSSLDPCG